jgi:hypothetical protein
MSTKKITPEFIKAAVRYHATHVGEEEAECTGCPLYTDGDHSCRAALDFWAMIGPEEVTTNDRGYSVCDWDVLIERLSEQHCDPMEVLIADVEELSDDDGPT